MCLNYIDQLDEQRLLLMYIWNVTSYFRSAIGLRKLLSVMCTWQSKRLLDNEFKFSLLFCNKFNLFRSWEWRTLSSREKHVNWWTAKFSQGNYRKCTQNSKENLNTDIGTQLLIWRLLVGWHIIERADILSCEQPRALLQIVWASKNRDRAFAAHQFAFSRHSKIRKRKRLWIYLRVLFFGLNFR